MVVRTLVDGLSFPESPRWWKGTLWFSDIHAHRVYRLGPDGSLEVMAQLDDRASGLGFLPDGTPIVVSMLDRRLIALENDGTQRPHADLAHLSRQFINDMVVDRQGNAYVGSRNGGTAASKSDSVLLVRPDGSANTLLNDMISPNGAIITPDGRRLIIAETAVGRLTRFDIGRDGLLHNRQTMAELRGHHIDGICRDVSGGIWAGGGTGGLLRIASDGTLEDVINFPGRMVLACSLGGPDGKTLFLATTSLKLLENLDYIGFDRTLDRTVNSIGQIEEMAVDIPGGE